MSSDNKDKTVFRQSSGQGAGGSDRTVLRPTPGGRRQQSKGQSQAQQTSMPPSVSSEPIPKAHIHYQEQDSGAPQQAVPRAAEFTEQALGLNPIVNAASVLIAVFEKTRQANAHSDVAGLHQQLVNELSRFEKNLKQSGLQPEIVLSARYCICTALDEAVLNTPWGSESGWSQRTLLSIFHNETAGGEKFFLILDRMLEHPAANIQMLEFLYILLSLGFEGKYKVVNRGRDALEQLRDEVFNNIRRQRGEYERSLSPNWQGLGRVRNSLTSYIPLWVVASVLGVVLLMTYSGFRIWLYESSTPVVATLQTIIESEKK